MRAVRMMRFTLASAIAAGWILSGCGNEDNPVKPPNPPGSSSAYLIRSTPQNVLTDLEIAYSHRDSTECQELYDSSYVGMSVDLNDSPGTPPLYFTYSDEVGHVAALAHSPTISSVSLSFGSSASWSRLESSDPSHPEWATIQIAGSSFRVEITEDASTFQASGSTEFLEFMFKPSTPESTSQTDTLWTIVKWKEVRAAGP